MTAATETRPPHGSISFATSDEDSATDTIPPRPDSARMALLRSATTRAPSSRLNAPATQAAAISPWL
ncbi:hypothetical protein Stsp01_55500 [Streptomyces sp. NBRC 13847]|nr:hypothetical protein Stsp01_55500 [Streptomyces sp. NBRC 13847]